MYMANVSLQMNDTMRVLTVFNTIFLPLSVVAVVYGMNGFDLTTIFKIPQGFIIVIITMIIITSIILWFFKKKQWIFQSDNDNDDDNIKTKKEK